MPEANTVRSWIARHKSILFILGLLLGGVGFALIGIFIENATPYLGKLLTEISLALIVGSIAAVFLSLEEVRKMLSATLAELFTQGEIAGLLSAAARETLMQKLVQERLGTGVRQVEPTLYKSLIRDTDEYLKSIHLRDFYVTTDFEAHPRNADFLSQQTTITFRIHIAHLRSERAISFPYRYSYRVIVPVEIADGLKDEDFLLNFSVAVGGEESTDCEITRERKEALTTIKFKFEKKFDLRSDETDVSLNYRAAALKGDNTSISRVRYPTRGFAKTIHYTDDFNYDCAWFATVGQQVGEAVNEGKIERIPRGLTTRRYDWLLPGEGVALFWWPRTKRAER